MYKFIAAAMLGAAASAKDYKSIFDTGMSTAISNIGEEAQILKFGYSYDTSAGMDPTIFEHLGFAAEFEADLAGGYTFPVGWVHEDDENFFTINPAAFITAAIEGAVTFKLYWIEWSFHVLF